MPRTATLDAARIVATLHRHGVEYIVIGGLAAGAGGVVWTTFDADIVVESSTNNTDPNLGDVGHDGAGSGRTSSAEPSSSERSPAESDSSNTAIAA